MRIYYYHTQDIQYIWREWEKGSFPGHLLYGATHLSRHGIEVIQHEHRELSQRWKITLRTTWKILTCRRRYDILYGTSFRGLELIIMLRALGLYRHKIVIWHHQPIKKSGNAIREIIAGIYYKGIDRMFFFSKKIVDTSLLSSKADPKRMHIVRWGADMDYYDRVLAAGTGQRGGFISTGTERRDMPTLVSAFNRTGEQLDIYVNRRYLGENYDEILGRMSLNGNIAVHFTSGLKFDELCHKVCEAQCVVICCLETDYTVGLTTLVEALALGMPVICSRNPQMPVDIEKEGCGIAVDYGDTEGWIRAVEYISRNPEEAREMGRRGRRLAQQVYNLEQCAAEVSGHLKNEYNGR